MHQTLTIRVLGTLEIAIDDHLIDEFNSYKTRALLVYLALNQQQHMRRALAGLLWGDMPEEKAQRNLRKSISNLKGLVGEWLIIERQTLRFDAGKPHQIDSEAFASAVGTDEAVQLYAGEFLKGIYIGDAPEFEQWIVRQRVRLQQQMVQSLQILGEFASDRGTYEAALTYGHRLLTLEPWREETHRMLMLLYARLGERSAAAHQYELCQAAMKREFGVEPTPDTLDLMRRIKYAPLPAHNLPVSDERCVGYEQELAQIDALLRNQSVQLISLVGAGGMGKTRLALEIGKRIRPNFLEGVWFVDVTAITDPSQLPGAISAALDLQPNPSQPREAQLLNYLRDRELLLIIDNFEQLISGRQFLLKLIQSAPQLKIIVTTREQLRLRDEHVVYVDGFRDIESAVDLFTLIVRQLISDFDSEQNREPVREICSLVHGSPLAIELAAGSAHFLPCAHIAAAVKNNLDVLESSMHDVPDRHRSVRAVFDHTWSSLSAELQHAFAHLAVFRGGFSLPAALAVCDVTPTHLSNLLNKSLIRRQGDRYYTHELLRQYAWEYVDEPDALLQSHCAWHLALIGQQQKALIGETSYDAQKRLRADSDNLTLAWNYAIENHLLEHSCPAASAWFNYNELNGNLDVLDTSSQQLLKSLQQPGTTNQLTADEHLDIMIRTTAFRVRSLLYRGDNETALNNAQRAVNMTTDSDSPATRSIALATLCKVHFEANRFAEMAPALTELEQLLPQLGDTMEKVRALNWRAILLGHDHRNAQQAIEVLTTALEIARRGQIATLESIILTGIGAQYFNKLAGETEATHFLEAGAALARKLGSWQALASALTWLMHVDFRLNRMALARQRLEEVIALYERVNNHVNLGQAYMNLGLVGLSLEDIQEARSNLDLALGLHLGQGQNFGAMMTLTYLGRLNLLTGKLDASKSALADAFERASELAMPGWVWSIITFQVELCAKLGDAANLDEADKIIGEYEQQVADSENARVQMWFASARAAVCLVRGQLEQALVFANEGVLISQGMVERYQVDALARLGEVQAALGDWVSAEKTWLQVLALHTELNRPISAEAARKMLDLVRTHAT